MLLRQSHRFRLCSLIALRAQLDFGLGSCLDASTLRLSPTGPLEQATTTAGLMREQSDGAPPEQARKRAAQRHVH